MLSYPVQGGGDVVGGLGSVPIGPAVERFPQQLVIGSSHTRDQERQSDSGQRLADRAQRVARKPFPSTREVVERVLIPTHLALFESFRARFPGLHRGEARSNVECYTTASMGTQFG